jgi:outer membrane protein OmpA-like peptidoglycan-associated protein
MSVENGGSGLASSFTDLMTSLAVIFILLFVSTLNKQGAERENRKRETQNIVVRDVGDRLDRFKVLGVRVEPDAKDPLIVRIITPEKLLRFAVNESTIPEGGSAFLEKFAPALVEAVSVQASLRHVASLVVEGHTDLTGTDAHNLRLSQERATEVSLQILDILGRVRPDLKTQFMNMQSTAGRGYAEPLPAEGPEDEAAINDRNRRVVFKVRLSSPEDATLLSQVGEVRNARP